MGPRLDSRGDNYITSGTAALVRLEWGHDWIVVETRTPPTLMQKLITLEWGHDWIVVETSKRRMTKVVTSYLNGATTG